MSCRRRIALVPLCWTLLALAASAPAQNHVTLRPTFEPAQAAPGDEVTLTIRVLIEDGWHIYGAKETGSIPTTLDLPPGGAAGLLAVGTARFDDGVAHDTGSIQSYWVTGEGTLRQRFKVPADAAPGAREVSGKVEYMACTEQACDPPSSAEFTARLEVTGPAAAPLVGPNGKLRATLRVEPRQAAPGAKIKVIAACEMVPGWHVYGSQEKDTGIPVGLRFTDLQSATATGGATVPPGSPHRAGSLTSYWVAGKFELSQELQLPVDAKAGALRLRGQIDYMACDDSSCLPPTKLPFELEVQIAAAGAPPAQAATQTPPPAASPQPTPTYDDADGKLTLRPRVEPWPVRAGETLRLVIDVDVIDGWHVYGTKEETSVPTALSLSELGGLRLRGNAVIPPGEPHDLGGFTAHELKGQFKIEQALEVPPGQAPGTAKVVAKVAYMPCDDSGCLNPTAIEFAIDVAIEAGAPRAEWSGGPPSSATTAAPRAGEHADLSSLWQLLLECFLGGLLALAMPCTYPMIPITFSFFTKQAEQRGGHVLGLALAYGIGIVLMFVVIGLAFGKVIIPFAGHWGTNAVLAGAFFLFALSLFGLFNLQLPSFVQNAAGRAGTTGGVLGVFFMGATLVVSSFTCTAPVVALLLARAAQGGDMAGVALGMGVFGLTMALPFVWLSLLPGKVKQLPRSGEWMNALKVTLGFVELVAALKFFSNVDVYFGWRILPKEVFLGLSAALLLATALYLFGVPRRPARMGLLRVGAGVLFALLAAWFVRGATGRPLDYVTSGLVPPYALIEVPQHEVVKDDPAQAVARAKAQDKLVLHDFTGFFCTNCRAMEEDVFRRPAVAAVLHRSFVESRQHVDVQQKLTETQFATNKQMQAELVGTETMPFYVIVDPKTGQRLRGMSLSGPPHTWERLFLDFLNGGSN